MSFDQYKVRLRQKIYGEMEKSAGVQPQVGSQRRIYQIVKVAFEEITGQKLSIGGQLELMMLLTERITRFTATHPDVSLQTIVTLIMKILESFFKAVASEPSLIMKEADILEGETEGEGEEEEEEEKEEIEDEVLPETYTDPNDPKKREIDYRGVDFQLKPKRGSYSRWHNVIRFNAPQHFNARYRKAYAFYEGTDPGADHSKLDQLAKKSVYQTLSANQVADYSRRIRRANKRGVYPEESAVPFMTDPRKLWPMREKLFDHKYDVSDQKLERIDEERPSKVRQKIAESSVDIGQDLLDWEEYSSWREMSADEYRDLRDRVRADIAEKLAQKRPGVSKGIRASLSRKGLEMIEAQNQKQIDAETDEYIRKNYLKYAFGEPYKRWYAAFQGKVKYNYPHRYKAIEESSGLDKFRESSKIRNETYRAFNQPQLSEWKHRVTHETELMGKRSNLPSMGDLKISPNFTRENRDERLRQFLRHKPEPREEPELRRRPEPRKSAEPIKGREGSETESEIRSRASSVRGEEEVEEGVGEAEAAEAAEGEGEGDF